tara:strand:- start:763 stop:1251 length:489 start_codon:yes stop_codon:yes gene_type:complete
MISSTPHKRTVDEAKNLISAEIFALQRKGHGAVKDRNGKEYADWVLVPRRIAQQKRIKEELSTIERAAIERAAIEKAAVERAEAERLKRTKEITITAEAISKEKPSQPSRDFNDLIEKGKQISEVAVDEEMDRKIEEEKGKDVYEFIRDTEEINKKKERKEI